MYRSYKVKKGPITVGQMRKLERLAYNLATSSPLAIHVRATLSQDLHGTIQAMIVQAQKEEQKRKIKANPLLAFSDKKFKKPTTCKVHVTRMGIGGNEIEIEGAVSERDAAAKAWDEAGNYEFSDNDSEYIIEDVQPQE
jgi:hypothetical protein